MSASLRRTFAIKQPMMSYFNLFATSAFSIALPSLVALFRFPALANRYLPFVILLWLGLANEIISYLLIIGGGNNGINSNIYTLLEGMLFLWLFYRWQPGKRLYYQLTAIACALCWAADNLLIHSPVQYNPLARLLFSTIILYLSMDRIVAILAHLSGQAFRKTDLFFYACFFLYFTYQAFLLIVDIFPMNVPDEFYKRLYLVLCLINFLTNLIYTVLILWIPRQTTYTRS